MNARPTFLRAAVKDWKAGQITTERLFELWRVPFAVAYSKLLGANPQLTSLPIEEIERILESCLKKEDRKHE